MSKRTEKSRGKAESHRVAKRRVARPKGKGRFSKASPAIKRPTLAPSQQRKGEAMKKCINAIVGLIYIIIWESELQRIAGMSVMGGDLETGGLGGGLFTRGGRPTICLVTGPGPDADHQSSHLQQDVQFAREMNRLFQDVYGLQWDLDWHKHPGCMNSPSRDDISQAVSVMRKTNSHRRAGIITTVRGVDYRHVPEGRELRRLIQRPPSSLHVTANAYIYEDSDGDRYHPAKIQVIPGMSPYRLAALANGTIDSASLGEYASGFPMDHIVYDAADPHEDMPDTTKQIPESLVSQLRQLPKEAQRDDIHLNVNDGLVIVALPLPDGSSVDVSVDLVPPHCIRGVYVRNYIGAEPKDVTAMILAKGRELNLGQTYELLSAMVREDDATPRATPKGVKAFLSDFWHGHDAGENADLCRKALEEETCHGA